MATAGLLACAVAVLFIIRDARRGESPNALFISVGTDVGVPSRPIDLFFNWILPIAMIWWAVSYTIRYSKCPHEAPQTHATPRSDRRRTA